MQETSMHTGGTSEGRPRVSVLMPTFNQRYFICRAIESLLAQTMTDWELVIIDDGSPDDTHNVVKPYLTDARIHYHSLESNQGLGAALNQALLRAKAPLICYLPSDDVYFADHLASLSDVLDTHTEAVLAYSGVRYEARTPGIGMANKSSTGQLKDGTLQLVQVMHRRTADHWVERNELVTDDLSRMFWSKLGSRGSFVGAHRISCQWVDHPLQRHKVMQEPLGGINPYRMRYHVKHPLRFHTSTGNAFDEVEHYRRFRERADTPFAADGLKILLVGELAYNPERILALEERGHKLYGLWTSDGHWFNTVGPLPFGHVEDLPQANWREAIRKLRPDVIYALLNWQAVPFAHQVLIDNPDVPFVWHFKEGPFDCIANGTWSKLMDLYRLSAGQIYCSPEMRDWFRTVSPAIVTDGQPLVLDGDLPKNDWFTSDRSPLLSEADGQIHLLVPGAPVGLHSTIVAPLAQAGIHLHLYGEFNHGFYRTVVEEALRVGKDHVHLHPNVDQEQWVAEFSKYDAGCLHLNKSENEGDIGRANWGDLNYPARIPTLVTAGVPLVQYENGSAIVATKSLVRELDIGLFFSDAQQLSEQLRDEERMALLRNNVWHHREKFMFDYHADRLINFLRKVIEK